MLAPCLFVETPPPPSGMNFLNQIDEDIWQLQNRLPPIDRKAILREIKAEQAAQEAIENRCTCVLVECTEEEAGVEPSGEPQPRVGLRGGFGV